MEEVAVTDWSKPTDLKFVPVGRRKASTMARAYVYQVVYAMLDDQLNNHPENVEGWMFGGIENEFDRQRLTKEIRQLQAEMARRSKKIQGTK